MKRIAIVDTVGSVGELVPVFKARFPFVTEWRGHTVKKFLKHPPHPHGAMCCEKALQPLWRCGEDVVVYFLRIFDSNGTFIATDEEILSCLSDWAKEDASRLYVNNSWGMYVEGQENSPAWNRQARLWREFIRSHSNVVVTWAAGNDGDYAPDNDNDMPQTLLTDVSFKIGSMNSAGIPSRFSSDSKKGRPTCVYMAENVKLFNGVTGAVETGSGTSFAAPIHTGFLAARGLDFPQGFEYCRRSARGPDAVRAKPHPKFGFGSMQHEVEPFIAESPYLLSNMRTRSIKSTTVWFDMKKVEDNVCLT